MFVRMHGRKKMAVGCNAYPDTKVLKFPQVGIPRILGPQAIGPVAT